VLSRPTQLSEHILTHARCLAHVVNLAIVDFMSHIMKIAVVESSNAIWEYDPSTPGNRVLSGSLDVISAIRTLAIKARFPLIQESSPFIFYCRFSPRRSELNVSSGFKFNAESLSRSRSHYMGTRGGGLLLACSTEPIGCARYVNCCPTPSLTVDCLL
jgi:hypothetical protein